MKLEFDSLEELKAFLDFVDGRIVPYESPRIESEFAAPEPEEPAPRTKRKRRTPEEIELSRLEAQQALAALPEPVAPPVLAVVPEPERVLEVSKVDHIKHAREFIGKHGMTLYNESFALAGLTTNIVNYTPEECGRHVNALKKLAHQAAA